MTENKPDLLRVLEHYEIEVRDMGPGNQLILCPVHSEDRPSCSVHVEKGLWNCKACLATGDAFTIIMQREGLGFREAVEFAEQRFGYEREDRRPKGRVGFGGRQARAGTALPPYAAGSPGGSR